MAATKNSIIWFRKGLRLHDNPALLEACKDAAHVYPVFVLDPYFLQQSNYKVSVNRYNFLLESLRDLDASFKTRGSRLLVLRGQPEEVLPQVMREWGVRQLCFEVDTEPYAKTRDARVRQVAEAAGVEVFAAVSHTLYDTEYLVHRNGGRPPTQMKAFTKLVDEVGDPPAPAPDPPAAIPPPAEGMPSADPRVTGVPTWQEVGFKEPPTTIFKGGETEALQRLDASLADPAWVASFAKPDTDPSTFTPQPSTTVLSPYLKFGCLSARLFHARLLAVYRSRPGHHTQPPVSLRGQLLWREFFYTVGSHTPNFHRMAGNPVCRQIGWEDNPEFLAAWREARTGYPWIDAIMTQLRQWGWMHHLARHSVACFLTRGDLYVSWERGVEVFEEHLIDQDYFLNAANWMWLSASAFFNEYWRVYSPVAFGKKYDPEGKFVRQFLPVLKDMPSRYIFEPWTAPLEVQRRTGCLIGRDYPRPIVDHPTASKRNIERMKAAYAANKGGSQAAGGGGPSGARAAQPAAHGATTTSTATATATATAATNARQRKGRQPATTLAAAMTPPTTEAAGRVTKEGGKRQRTIQEALKPSPSPAAVVVAAAAGAAAEAPPSPGKMAVERAAGPRKAAKGAGKRQRTIQEALTPSSGGESSRQAGTQAG